MKATGGTIFKRHISALDRPGGTLSLRPLHLKFVVEALGLEVVSFPFRGRIKESIVDGVIGVRPGLSREWFRWYVAHAIGHHLMHVGTSFYLDSWQWASHAKAERQAEEFAAALLGGPDAGQRTAAELGVPAAKLGLVKLVCDGYQIVAI